MNATPRSRRSRKKIVSGAVIALVIFLIAIRAVLPIFLQDYVNRTLDRIPKYDGRIGDVDLHLWRGAYSIQNVDLVKTTAKESLPFFSTKVADFSIEWHALLKGRIVGEVVLEQANLNFINRQNPNQSQLSIDKEWLSAVKDLFPFRINRFEIKDGTIHYRTEGYSQDVNVELTSVDAVGTNFSNTRQPTKGLVAQIEGNGMVEKEANVWVAAKIASAEQAPTFTVDVSMAPLKIVRLNDLLRSYLAVDAQEGTISIDGEMVSEKGSVHGYIKPLLRDVKIFSITENIKNPFKAAWEGLVAIVSTILENQRKEQIGTHVEFSGDIHDEQIDVWDTILGILKNAFITALQPGVENTLDLSTHKRNATVK